MAGFLTLIDAIMGVRTPQGAIAWAIALNTMPYISVPAYWVFGRSEFQGYVKLRRGPAVIAAQLAFVEDWHWSTETELALNWNVDAQYVSQVDVRILIPDDPDHYPVYLVAFSFLNKFKGTGMKFYRYTEGFMHQKAMLVDNDIGVIGTANLDNRSFRLNFEITAMMLE